MRSESASRDQEPRTFRTTVSTPKDNVAAERTALHTNHFRRRTRGSAEVRGNVAAYVTRTRGSNVTPYVYAMKMSDLKPKEMTR
jgi:hypothetical protein